MTFSVTTDFTSGTQAQAAQVNTNFEDVEDELNGTTNDGSIGSRIKASGTVSVTNATYDNDYVDIAFTAGELTSNDIVEIKILGQGNSTSFKVNILNTSSDGDCVTTIDLFPASEFGICVVSLYEDPTTNTKIHGISRQFYDEGSGTHSTKWYGGEQDTTDANVFTTSWTARLNLKGTTRILRYIVTIIKG